MVYLVRDNHIQFFLNKLEPMLQSSQFSESIPRLPKSYFGRDYHHIDIISSYYLYERSNYMFHRKQRCK